MASDRADLTRQIKEANDIVAVVGGYLTLHPAGSHFKAICPFHKDTRPSLQISAKYQSFRCWSCGERGDVFDFIQKMEKVDFPQAQEILAQRAGITIQGAVKGPSLAKLRLLDAMKWAEQEYRECLLEEPYAEQARQYLGERKLNGQTVRKFGLGFAPLDGGWLARRARETRQDLQTLLEVGLLMERKEGGYCDRFRDRVMFPIRDVLGKTVGFGGRILPGSAFAARGPKYYNSADNPLFKKSDLLYGLDLARHAGTSEGFLAVVEGYTDVMMAHQFGITNVVATMGTALTERHVSQLGRYAKKIVLVYDADDGGKNGVDRALELFISQDVDLAIATLPAGLDPCDLLLQQGAEALRSALVSAVDALDFKLNQLLERESEGGIESTRRLVNSVLGIMALAPELPAKSSKVKQELVLTRIAQRLGIRLETLQERYRELRLARKAESAALPFEKKPFAEVDPAETDRVQSGPAPQLEVQLLQFLLADDRLVAVAAKEVPSDELTHPGLRKLLAGLYQLQAAGERADIDGLRSLVPNPALIAKAMEMREVGRLNPEPEKWLRQVLGRFAARRKEAEKGLTQQKLSSADHQSALELFSKLQTQSVGKDS